MNKKISVSLEISKKNVSFANIYDWRGRHGLPRLFSIAQGIEADAPATGLSICVGVALGCDAIGFGVCGAACGHWLGVFQTY